MEHWFDKIAKGFGLIITSISLLLSPATVPEKITPETSPVILKNTATTAPPSTTLPQNTLPTTTPSKKSASTTTSTKKIPKNTPAPSKKLSVEKEFPPSISLEAKSLPLETSPIPSPKSWSDINIATKSSIVNIFCQRDHGGDFTPISGTGVVVNERGIVLTVAHVAQYFLLKDYPKPDALQCIARTGSPAKNEYELELVYLPLEWLERNINNVIEEVPKGTGEYDFALVKIVRRIDKRSTELLPNPFTHLTPALPTESLILGSSALASAYPAGFLGGVITNLALYNSSSLVTIGQLFSFSTSTVDLFSIGGSIVAQRGSSGGAIISDREKLLGIIVTSTEGVSTNDRTLSAISMEHINTHITDVTGATLSELLTEKSQAQLVNLSYQFNTYLAPQLTQALIKKIERR